jgi:hypothetical protein
MCRGKEIKLNNLKNLNAKIGTVDNKNPKSIYISLSGWAQPSNDDVLSYGKVIKNINKEIKQTLFNSINNIRFDHNKTIIDFDMRESGILYGKKSYMCCDINLYQKSNLPLMEIKNELNNVFENIIPNIFNNNPHFIFYKRK